MKPVVAIPSNRVNVSYLKKKKKEDLILCLLSQSPQIGSMFLTFGQAYRRALTEAYHWSQSPQIGSMFLTIIILWLFLIGFMKVAIPSNRVNVSYRCLPQLKIEKVIYTSQSPQIGSMFLTRKTPKFIYLPIRMSQSPQIGSMFLTAPIFSCIL